MTCNILAPSTMLCLVLFLLDLIVDPLSGETRDSVVRPPNLVAIPKLFDGVDGNPRRWRLRHRFTSQCIKFYIRSLERG